MENYNTEIKTKLLKMVEAIGKYQRDQYRKQHDGILVSPNGKLLALYGNAMINDYVKWYNEKYSKKK